MTSGLAKEGRTKLLDKLWKYQLEDGFVSRSAIKRIADELQIATIQVEGVLSFYHFFHTEPTGRYTIYLNTGAVAVMKGFKAVREAFEKETNTKVGSVDSTGTFGLFETSCIGLCDYEPAALINFRPFINLTPDRVHEIIHALNSRKSVDDIADTVIDRVQHDLGDDSVFFKPYNRGEILQKGLKMMPGDIIEEIKWSGLSGRGGAFYPTGLKWDICRKGLNYQKYIICNADEGEPGTFKDRLLLNNHIGLLLEGMILAGYTVGASKGFIYLRAEYFYLKEKIEAEIEKFHQLGLLGEHILGTDDFDFDVRVQMGGGSYVCGEETALIQSLEGMRGEPRTKIFFPVEKGFNYKPTVVNNVETFCAAARIIDMGGPAYREMGTALSTGSKLFSVSGDCSKPGIYEIMWGTKVSKLLELCGAEDTKFVQWSGPSGTLLNQSDFDRQINNEDMLCGGAVTIFNSSRRVIDVMRNYTSFFIEESCGLCTPCRAGNYLLGKKIKRIRKGKGAYSDLDDLRKWSQIIKKTSRCGLGKTSTNFIIHALEKFPEEIEAELNDNGIELEHEFDINDYTQDYADFAHKMNNHG